MRREHGIISKLVADFWLLVEIIKIFLRKYYVGVDNCQV